MDSIVVLRIGFDCNIVHILDLYGIILYKKKIDFNLSFLKFHLIVSTSSVTVHPWIWRRSAETLTLVWARWAFSFFFSSIIFKFLILSLAKFVLFTLDLPQPLLPGEHPPQEAERAPQRVQARPPQDAVRSKQGGGTFTNPLPTGHFHQTFKLSSNFPQVTFIKLYGLVIACHWFIIFDQT